MQNFTTPKSRVRWLGQNPISFQQVMGRGGVMLSGNKSAEKSRQPSQSGQPDSQSAPKEWQDQIAVEAWEAMHNKEMTPEIAAELGLSVTPAKRD